MKPVDYAFALQDLVNEIGRRLGFQVEHGLYQGKAGGETNFDGVWASPGTDVRIVVDPKQSKAARTTALPTSWTFAGAATSGSIALKAEPRSRGKV